VFVVLPLLFFKEKMLVVPCKDRRIQKKNERLYITKKKERKKEEEKKE
jgi:hypothetical protein